MKNRTRDYLATALCSSTVMLPGDLYDGRMDVDDDHPLYGIADDEPLSQYFGIEDFTEDSLTTAEEDLDDWFHYLERQGLYERALEYADDERIAHDFWLTRNGHGAGYWDGDYGDIGDKLTDACKAWRGQDIMISVDGRLHLEG